MRRTSPAVLRMTSGWRMRSALPASARWTNHMAIPFSVDSLDSVPAAQRALYVERENKFHVNVDEFAEFKALGVTASAMADLIAEKQAAPEQLDKILSQHEAAAATKIAALEKELGYARAVERDALV